MLDKRIFRAALLFLLFFFSAAPGQTATGGDQSTSMAPHDLKVSVKIIGPITQESDLQVLCILQHKPNADRYIEAMADFNAKVHGLLSSLRDRGEFDGATGETLLFTPPSGWIAPRQVLLIGVGDESALTLEQLRLVGRIAAREATRLHARTVGFAPTLRDQGSNRIEVGAGDAAFAEQFVLAYDTEVRLASQQLDPPPQLAELVIEAGPKFFPSAAEKVAAAVKSAASSIEARSDQPLVSR
jgi:hypothetical protein